MLKQTLAQKLQQKLSPQQIQLMKLVQLPTQSLEARIKQEIEENPALLEGREKSEDTFESDVNTDTDEREVRDSLEEVNWDDYLGDEDTPDYRTKSNNYSSDDELYEVRYAIVWKKSIGTTTSATKTPPITERKATITVQTMSSMRRRSL